MRRRALGRTDIEIAPVALGTWAVGGWAWGGSDDARSVEAIAAAVEAGVDAIDTAPVYGFGHAERVVGQALRALPAERRAGVVLMTKVGLRWDAADGEFFFRTKGLSGETLEVFRNARPESVRVEVERSLERLGVERLDLVQVHWPDPTTPIDETLGALLDLRAAGRVRALGVSNFDVDELEAARAALGDVPLASDQPPYSLLRRGIEADVLPWAREHGVAVLAYSPLEQGLLTGHVPADRRFAEGDARAKSRAFAPAVRAAVGEALATTVGPLAERHGATPGQVALAWVLAQPGVTAALVGARTPEQARENAGAGELELSPEELDDVARAFAEVDVEAAPRGIVRRVLGRLRLRRGGMRPT